MDRTVEPVDKFTAGYTGGMKNLFDFVTKRIRGYDEDRNDPTKDYALSNVSPWLHFGNILELIDSIGCISTSLNLMLLNIGQIAAQRCALSAKKFASKYKKSVDAFCEELIIRRELSDNFCFYNKDYDNIKGAENWARITLDEHR